MMKIIAAIWLSVWLTLAFNEIGTMMPAKMFSFGGAMMLAFLLIGSVVIGMLLGFEIYEEKF